jgi:cell division protein FtsB
MCYLKLGKKLTAVEKFQCAIQKERNDETRWKKEGQYNYFWANNNAYIVRHAFVHTLRFWTA